MFDQCHWSLVAKLKAGEKTTKQNPKMTTIISPNVIFILDICHKNKVVNKPTWQLPNLGLGFIFPCMKQSHKDWKPNASSSPSLHVNLSVATNID
jgi:hypothetical protein